MNDSTWTWVSGSDTAYQPGVYGSKGNASSLRGGIWLFGGSGYGNTANIGE